MGETKEISSTAFEKEREQADSPVKNPTIQANSPGTNPTIQARAKRLAKKTVKDFFNRDVGTYASSMAFFFFMALIPLLIIILQMIPHLGLSQENLITFINKLIPEAAQGFAAMVVREAYKSSRGALSLSALVRFWAASTATRALRQGLNQVYDVEENRSFPIRCLMSIGYTLALIVIFAVMLFMVFVGPVTSYLMVVIPDLFTNPITIEMHDQVLITLSMLVFFVLIYTFIPAGRRSFLRQIPGALLDAVVWTIFSKLFGIYVRGSNAYTMFYGSLGSIAILLFWLYCCFYIVLIGAYFNRFCGERWDRIKKMIMRRKRAS